MASISNRILDACLRGERWSHDDLRRLLQEESPALFSVVAEGLSDRFDSRLAEVYAEIFAEAIAAVRPEFTPDGLVARYARVRRPRRIERDPPRVYVLSRITLGADIAITSVVLDAAKRRFPNAHIVLVGTRKSYELFSADDRIEHMEVSYGRNAGPAARINACPWSEDGTVIDPDSRLTQLGLLPVCPEENYFFFDSRCDGGDESLGVLVRRWVAGTLGIPDARAYIAPGERPSVSAEIAVSLGVGDNAAKRVANPFEPRLIAALAERGSVIVDAGAGGEEAERVHRAICESGARVETWNGSFAGFASIVSRARLYVGYDSAGQHAAAACGVPLVSVFAGYPCERFCRRWRPESEAPAEVIRVFGEPPESVLARTVEAGARLLAKAGR